MKRVVTFALLALNVVTGLANEVSDALKNPHNGDFMICRSENDPANLTYLLTQDGEVYTSNSPEKNPSKIDDFTFLSQFKLLDPDEKEMYVFSVGQKKYKADMVREVMDHKLIFVLTYEDDDNYQSSGLIIDGQKELAVTCYDLTGYLIKNN